MNTEARQFIHMGINHIVSPTLDITRERGLLFQQSLIAQGIDFTGFSIEGTQIKVERKPPFPLQILIVGQTSQPQPVGQILVLAPRPERALSGFAQEALAVLSAAQDTWLQPNQQIVGSDVTLRYLYPSTSAHAFEEIWEQRLCQSGNSLAIFERPVLGGGLRFVMPPQPTDSRPTQIEIKIESYLNDVTKVFVEAQVNWRAPQNPGEPFRPVQQLEEADAFVRDKVHAFMMGGGQ